MKRRMFRIGLFLLLGVIINVAVAWGCAVFIRFDWQQQNGHDLYANWGNPNDRFHGYTANRWTQPGAHRVTVFFSNELSGWPGRTTIAFPAIIPPWAAAFIDVPELSGRQHMYLDESSTYLSIVDARGWPCLALWGGVKAPHPGLTAFTAGGVPVRPEEHRYCIIPIAMSPKSGAGTEYRWLPLHPIWPGFAINTIFYAVILWLPFAAFGRIRRRWRIKRGLCPACAYPVGDSAVCTECGKAVKA